MSAGPPFITEVRPPPADRRPASRPPSGLVLLVALLGAAGYAAFARGGIDVPEETWLQAGLAVLALVAAAAWLGPGSLRPSAAPLAVAGLLVLVALAAWTGASLLWSVTPDRTWAELNRTLAYALVVALAIAAGSSAPRAVERVAAGWLVVATAVALYALAGKVVPGVVDHATEVSRLRAPLEYWNALALVCVLATPIAIRLAAARGLASRWRILALVALLVLLVCAGMTYSRGAVLALVVATVAVTAAPGPRLAGLAVLGLALLAAAPVLAFAWTEGAITVNAAPLDEQIDAGLQLGLALALAAALLALAGWWLLRAEARVRWTRARDVQAWVVLAAVLVGLLAGGIGVLATSDRGLGGSVEHAVETFTKASRDPVFEPGRLLTTGSGNRWAWWNEAVGAWSDEPVLGWGAGSFPVTRRLYREAPDEVLQPHSVPIQWLTELGLVGLLLGVTAFGLLLAAAIARVRSRPRSRERDLAGALVAAACAWAVHACLDWDWDIPGVTVPVLLFLGVLVARRRDERPATAIALEEPRPVRPVGLFAAGLLALGFAVSCLLPAWSDERADSALAQARDRSPAALEAAAADAGLATKLDPLAVRPLFAAAAVAEARGRPLEARARLLEAVDRQPWSIEAWKRLTRLGLTLADRDGVVQASRRVLALNPADPETIAFVSRAQGILATPEMSATAVGTPLPDG